jgi:hypothetical protein
MSQSRQDGSGLRGANGDYPATEQAAQPLSLVQGFGISFQENSIGCFGLTLAAIAANRAVFSQNESS